MYWVRHHRRSFMRFTLAVWVLALWMAAFQGCLVQPDHNLAASHNTLFAAPHADDHASHASGCLQHCADAAVAISPSLHIPTLDIFSWAILLLLPALALLNPANISTFAFLALRHRASPGPPARLLFVRFND